MPFPLVSRADARASGKLHYFTGPCKNGHVALRMVSTGQCLSCACMWQAKYYAVDPTKSQARGKRWYAENRDANLAKSAAYYAEHREVLLPKKKTYNHENLARWREIEAARRADDIGFRLLKAIRSRIRSALKRQSKDSSSFELLGCSVAEFIRYVEVKFRDGMSWKVWGKVGSPGAWELDHIRPIGAFDMARGEDVLAAFHYSNHQPLLIEEHRLKSKLDHRLIRELKRRNSSSA